MTEREQQAVAAIALMAALADGDKDEQERTKLKAIFASMGGADLTTIYTRVLLKQTDLQSEAAVLSTPEARRLTYEFAVAVVDADGVTTDSERSWLTSLQAALALDNSTTEPIVAEAEALAEAPVDQDVAVPATVAGPDGQPVAVDTKSIDSTILKFAILCGGLELLPQSLATMAIIPLQMKLVYQVGKAYGVGLDRGHIKEFLATVGIGMTSQVLEQSARKLLGGFLGGFGKKAAQTATGAMMTFGTTWALGQVAMSYYGSGRKLDMQHLKAQFAGKVEEGKQLFEQHRPAVEQSARTTDLTSLMSAAKLN